MTIEVPGERTLFFPYNNREAEIIHKLVQEYVTYIRCFKKCSASSYCKYATDETKCKPHELAIRNFFLFAGREVDLYDPKKLKVFIETALIYGELAVEALTYGGFGADSDYFGFWKTRYLHTPLFMSGRLKAKIELYHTWMAKLAPAMASRRVLVVEGKSERIIFSQFAQQFYIDEIINLQGGTNRLTLNTLLPNLRDRGERVFVILDGDGRKNVQEDMRNLKKRRLLRNGSSFVFRKALEDSFPLEVVRTTYQAVLDTASHPLVDHAVKNSRHRRTVNFSQALSNALRSSGRFGSNEEREKFVSDIKLKAAESFKNYLSKALSPGFQKSEALRAVKQLRRFCFSRR